MERLYLFLAIQVFMFDTVQELDPDLQLNNELLETLKSDCEMIDSHYGEFGLDGYSMDMENEYRDLVLEFHFSNFELTPNSVWLSVFPHVSSVEFRTEDDLIMMRIKYKNIFLN